MHPCETKRRRGHGDEALFLLLSKNIRMVVERLIACMGINDSLCRRLRRTVPVRARPCGCFAAIRGEPEDGFGTTAAGDFDAGHFSIGISTSLKRWLANILALEKAVRGEQKERM